MSVIKVSRIHPENQSKEIKKGENSTVWKKWVAHLKKKKVCNNILLKSNEFLFSVLSCTPVLPSVLQMLDFNIAQCKRHLLLIFSHLYSQPELWGSKVVRDSFLSIKVSFDFSSEICFVCVIMYYALGQTCWDDQTLKHASYLKLGSHQWQLMVECGFRLPKAKNN